MWTLPKTSWGKISFLGEVWTVWMKSGRSDLNPKNNNNDQNSPLIFKIQVSRPATMKKDGIQTRNRKISSKLKKIDSLTDSLSGLPSHPDFQMPPFWNPSLHHQTPGIHGPVGHSMPATSSPSSLPQGSQDGFNPMAFNPSYHGFHGFH